MRDYQPPQMRNTRWTNPTKQAVTVLLFVGSSPFNPTGKQRVVIQPGETVEVDAKYDEAIQKVRGGKIVAGLAPQLIKDGGPKLPMDPALDVEASAQRAARDAIKDAAALKATAEGLLAEAASRAAVGASSAASGAEPEAPRNDQRTQPSHGGGGSDRRDRR